MGKAVNTPAFQKLERKIEQERGHFEEDRSPHEKGRFDQYHCLFTERANEELSSEQFDVLMLGIIVGMELMEHKQDILLEGGL